VTTSHWQSVKDYLKSALSPGAFRIWIEPIQVLGDDGQELVLGCPNRFSCQWVEQHFGREIARALDLASGGGAGLRIEVAPPPKAEAPERPAWPQPELPYEPGRLLRSGRIFNREFTFENFVTGPSNGFAHQAAQALASGQGLGVRALYLQAETGLGKSHLSQAVGQRLLEENPGTTILYLTAEDFTNQMISAIRGKEVSGFKDRFRRRCQTLILEEVHFLSGKESTQTELAYTLDALLNDGKRVVFTSSQSPTLIPGLKQELVSRLMTGLVTPIGPPDYETRLRILQAKARRRELDLPDEVAEVLARNICRDVRRLEAALLGVVAKSRLMGRPLTRDLALEVLGGADRPPCPDLEAVVEVVCRYYHISAEELASRSRLKRVAQPRAAVLYLCRRFTDESLAVIGRHFDRNHNTVLYALNRVERSLKRRDELGRQVEFLSQKLAERT